MITIDIESEEISDGLPALPKPVGVAIRWEDGQRWYYAFGHPEENNISWDAFRIILEGIWGKMWLTHNGLCFDVPDLAHWFNLPPRDPLLTHDTLFLSYLHNPHARSLSLKDLAVDWLGMEKDAQGELHDWIVRNVPECKTRKQAGRYICRAPGDLVGRYAMDDVEMTYRLFLHLQQVLETQQEPYDRERRLAPIVVDMQNIGIRCDRERLAVDTAHALAKLHNRDAEVRRLLNAPTLNPGSNPELGAVLKERGFSNFLVTPSGADSVAKDSLDKVLAGDPHLRQILKDRHTLATLTGTFMQPWLDICQQTGGYIHASYNQVRNPDGYGTRTGRLSSSRPNFQNVPNDLGPEYPVMRGYLLPDEGHIWTCGDFKAQEPRLAAHFEDGALCAAFNADPNLDPYIFVKDLVGQGVSRSEAKAIFLGLLYSQGVALLAEKLNCEPARATMLRNIIKGNIPDVVRLDNDCKRRFKMGLPIRTLGGRLYFTEPASNGRTWDYKALNTLIQGSAADQTKEALIFAQHELKLLDKSIRILGTVHDEYSVSHPPEFKEQVYEIMQLSANALPCDVPMLMDIATGNNWAEAQ